jgi:uncharacterized NAD(P)/FAD-binding protein YdhS
MVALHLARRAPGSLRILIFERGERLARGAAYGTSSHHHLLNVPARLMSAWPDEPDHFLNWLRTRDPALQPGTFAPRRLYGDYLEELLRDAVTGPGSTLLPIHTEIVDLIGEKSGSFTLLARDGGRFGADAVVLALGNPRPRDPIPVLDELRADRSYISNPWIDNPLGDLNTDDPILVIGSGLTAVDLIVEAQARGAVGKITSVSRHGLLPQAHAAVSGAPRALPPLDQESPLTARTLLRYLRNEAKRSEDKGGDWRMVIDALRPELPSLWKSLNDVERRRFLRHLSSYWDVHRHRVAPEIDEVIQRARREGRLSVLAGRVRAMSAHGSGVNIVVSRRGHPARETLFVRRVINCTGPSRDLKVGFPPLLGAILNRGLARPDPLGLGLEVSENGTLIGSNGRTQNRIFALGPVLKGQLWETTAVRELRQQAADLARHVIEALKTLPSMTVLEPHWNSPARLARVLERAQGAR